MSKYSHEWNEDKFKRYISEGRGLHEGKEYIPWLQVQDFPSKGRSSRIKGIKSGRVHHFVSDLQTKYFFVLEYDEADKICDIREFYPLLDFNEVVQDRHDLRVDIFTDKKTGHPYVLTTTFLITVKAENGKSKYVARSVISTKSLERNTTLEKLEMERRYWQVKGIDWAIVTEKDINPVKAKNAEWVLPTIYSFSDIGLSESDVIELGAALQLRMENNPKLIRNIVSDFDRDYVLDAGTGLFLFRYLVATKTIKFNIEIPIDLNASANTIQIVQSLEGEVRNAHC